MIARIVVCILVLTSFATAKTTLDVDPGFNGRFRSGRWSPVFVTVQSDMPRTGDLELHVANASGSVMSIHQTLGVGPEKQTYVLYAPLSMMEDPVRITLFDHDTGKPIAKWPEDDSTGNTRFGLGGEQIGFMAVTSGRTPMMAGLTRTNVSGPTLVTYLRPSLLPITPAGYDSLDLLALNHPDLEAMSVEQQQAIIGWVRSGGTLLIWPGPDPLPPGPLVDALPATVGDNATLHLPPDVLQQAGLGDRFATIGTRTLTPRDQAVKNSMLGDTTSAIAGRLGLGRIEVLPIDASVLQFSSADKSNAFWNALLDPFYTVTHESVNAYYNSPDMAASQTALDRIGNIPGTGEFGFSYVLIMVGVMMIVVGPVDYFVLKKLGRQPWTWTTTAGWIGLFTTGALLAGRLFQNGDLHFRTLQIFEQADGRIVGSDEVALIYAPRSATYAVTTPPDAWWQAVPSGNRYRQEGFSLPLDLDQDYRGTTPGPMWIDVWNFGFLQGRTYTDRPGWIETSLRHRDGKLIGSIKNVSDRTLSNITFRIGSDGTDRIDSLSPGKSQNIDMQIGKLLPADQNASTEPRANVPEQPFQIDPARDAAADRPPLPGATQTVHVIADVEDAVADMTITAPRAIQQHKAILRATIDLLP